MTQDEIISMAKEAGLTEPDLGDWMTDYGDAEESIKRFAALVAAKAAPEGWQLVPVVPTQEMRGILQWFDRGSPKQITEGWKEVLAAAPKP